MRNDASLNQSNLLDSHDNAIQINQISSSEPEISITNIEATSATSCDKRKHVASAMNVNSYNFRLKQKLRFENLFTDVLNLIGQNKKIILL